MNALSSLLVFILVSLCKSASVCKSTVPTQAKDCYNLPVDSNEYKCCYYHQIYTQKGKFHNYTLCDGVKEADYKNMANKVKSEIGYIKSQGGVIETYEIDCSSNYLYIYLLSLIVLLF